MSATSPTPSSSYRYFRAAQARSAWRFATAVTAPAHCLLAFTIREMNITANGLNVGPPLTDFHGVLSGIPTYTGKTDPLLNKNVR